MKSPHCSIKSFSDFFSLFSHIRLQMLMREKRQQVMNKVMRRESTYSLPYNPGQECALPKLRHQRFWQPLIRHCCSLNVFLPECQSQWPNNKIWDRNENGVSESIY